MIAICLTVIILVFSAMIAIVVGIIKLSLCGIALIAKKMGYKHHEKITQTDGYKKCKQIIVEKQHKEELMKNQKQIFEEDVYVYSQLEAWSLEMHEDNNTIRDCMRRMKNTYNEETKSKLNRKIIQSTKRMATDEKNIRVTCAKYGLNADEYIL